MNWWAWRCWFRDHEYEVQEIKPDPRHSEHSATLLWYMSEALAGFPGVKKCRRCYRVDEVVGMELAEDGTAYGETAMKLCYQCLDELNGVERLRQFRTTAGQTCDRCRRIEGDEPPSRAQSN